MTVGLPDISELLKYHSPLALHVFRRKFAVDGSMAEKIWYDMLLWLYLGRYHQLDQDTDKPKALVIFAHLLAIDEMWHAFILCTEEYATFCHHEFGQFIHHVPNGTPENQLTQSDFDQVVAYVTKILGADAAMRWFVHLPLLTNDIQETPVFQS